MTPASSLFEPGWIGTLELPNRIFRAGTSETMAGPRGEVTDELVSLYEELASNGVGLIVTGHMFCDARGRYGARQPGICSDDLVPGLARLADAVHRHGGRIFAQVSHAGSQCLDPSVDPLAPSPVSNAMTRRAVGEASAAEIEAALAAFAGGARRAVEAGFDGVHIMGNAGYLISEFGSPIANRRRDRWGGSAENRDRFALEVVRRVREVLPTATPLMMKLGFADLVAGGLTLEESLRRAARLVEAGVDGLDVGANLIGGYAESIRPYAALSGRRALEDLLLHRVFRRPAPEAYFRPWAEALRDRVDTTILMSGGFRRTETMEAVLRDGTVDFVGLARPFIREPDLVRQIEAGRSGLVDCTSCNLCLQHDGHHALRCWRTPRRRLVEHAVYRARGGFRAGSGVAPVEGTGDL
ncbi:MAG: hypothetical protein QOH58_23 [Thermoleophilaceae bacterium]|nr:hypothetical protein [Thermoleophilaceae bacterium]